MSYKFGDLMLLVGTNPLPNYVVSKYFLQRNDNLKRIWLVYSEEHKEIYQASTKELAQNIKKVIQTEFNNREINFEMIALRDVGSASQIDKNLTVRFKDENVYKNHIHLNYTGGTKTMAVHAYQFLKKEFKDSKPSFSYLDGRKHKIIWDDDENDNSDLREEMFLSLDNLIALHGYKTTGKEYLLPGFERTLESFNKLIIENHLPEYIDWKKATIRGCYYDEKGSLIRKVNGFLKHNDLISDGEIVPDKIKECKQKFKKKTPPYIKELLLTLPKDKSLLDEESELWIPNNSFNNKTTNTMYKDRLEFTLKFLDGKWLEQYVYKVILAGIQKDDLLNTKLNEGRVTIEENLELKRTNKQDSGKKFELDIIVVNGYQVCGISITTEEREGLCKLKGFEIIHRTQQMGGDEALSILITFINDEEKEKFANDLRQKAGTSEHSLLVLGLGDLEPEILWKKIRKYIWGDA